MDQHVAKAITDGLRMRGVDVLTAYEDGADRMSDAELLDRAGDLGRVLFTQDYDFLGEGKRRQAAHRFFRGTIYAHQAQISVGKCIHDLELMAKACTPEDLSDRIEFLPL
jgi:hypothetical protein